MSEYDGSMTLQILQYLPAKRKQSPSGWISFNAVCCHHRGEKQDRRGRGGIFIQPDGSFTANCFNCGFKATYKASEALSSKCKQLLGWLGVDSDTINRLNLEGIRSHNLESRMRSDKPKFIPKFEVSTLPKDCEELDSDNAEHHRYIAYLESRSIDFHRSKYYVTPSAHGRDQSRIIIPFTYENKLVGYTSRFIDGKTPKYMGHCPTGYVFGVDNQEKDWRYVVIVEGIFDAIQTNSLSVLHNDVSDAQVEIIQSLNKQVIVMPDRDRAGQRLIQRAVELGWAVSFPEWDSDVKDCADAVARYGRLTTIVSIIESAERSRMKIELRGRGIRD